MTQSKNWIRTIIIVTILVGLSYNIGFNAERKKSEAPDLFAHSSITLAPEQAAGWLMVLAVMLI